MYIDADNDCVAECADMHNATHCIDSCPVEFVSEDGYCGASCRPQFVNSGQTCGGTAPFCADNQTVSLTYRTCVSCSEPDKYFDRKTGKCASSCAFYNETGGVNICEEPGSTYCPFVQGLD